MTEIIAIVGPSGSGKDTIFNEVLARTSTTNKIVYCTTRPKRENEIQGKDYYFYSDEEFIKLLEEDKFLTVTCFNNWYYGVLKESLSTDKINIGVFNPRDVQNIEDTIDEDSDIFLTVYLVETSDKNRLMRQLARETAPDIDEIIRRYGTDKKDFQFYNLDFDYIRIENNTAEDFETAVQTIINVNSL